MSKVAAQISMSLDGFITGPDDSVQNPMGTGGERLHHWVFNQASWRAMHGLGGGQAGSDSDVIEESFRNVGAFVIGRRMFDHGVGPWGDDPPYHKPVFVLTHEQREPLVKQGGTTFHFVGGVENALSLARQAASGKDVAVMGGGQTLSQFLAAGLLDELEIHLVPVLFGAGQPLFAGIGPDQIELECIRTLQSTEVTHLKYRCAK